MRFYEVTFILRQDIQSPEVDAKTAHFVSIIANNGGVLHKKEYWGLRSLAYVVRDNKKGHYIMLLVEATGDIIKELERNFKLSEDIIKYLTVQVDEPEMGPSIVMQPRPEPLEKKIADNIY